MNLTTTESQLVALALNPAAAVGEIANSAVALFKSLRRRNVTPQQFASTNHDSQKKIDALIEINRTSNPQSSRSQLKFVS